MKKIFTFIMCLFGFMTANATVTTVWEGTLNAPEWGALSDVAKTKVSELVAAGTIKVGTKFTVYGTRTADDYCSVALVNESWTSVIDGTTGDDRTVLHLGDKGVATSESFTATDATMTALAGGFYLNGHGYTLTKIEIENADSPQPYTGVLYENAEGFTVNWNVLDAADQTMKDGIAGGNIKAGMTLKFDVQQAETDYMKLVLINENWESLLNGKKDDARQDVEVTDCSQPVSVTLTQDFIDRVTATSGGKFWVSGHGLKVTKIYVENGTTAINSVNAFDDDQNAGQLTVNNGVAYNLAGQRVTTNAKGIVIINGKKVVK